MTERKRPVSVTAIGWFILITGAVSLAWIVVMYAVPELQRSLERTGWGLAEATVYGLTGGLIAVASGWGILKGLNWGRLLYLLYVPLSLLLLSLLKGFDPFWLAYGPLYVVILVLLTRPAAAAFFASQAAPKPRLIQARTSVVIRRAASLILFAVGVFVVPVTLMVALILLFEGLFDLRVLVWIGLPFAIAVALMVAGVALWSRQRWRIVLGVVLSAAGGFAALTAAAFPLMMISPQWQTVEAPDETFIYRMILAYVLAGSLLAAAGITLIIAQKRQDQRVGR